MRELEAAHAAVGGTGAGRRTATQQINDAYIVLTAAHFQRYCRDVHTEAATHIVGALHPRSVNTVFAVLLSRDRQLDRGNAQPASLGSDFGRFGMDLWDLLERKHRRNVGRKHRLAQLNVWRNAIAHQDFALKPDQRAIVGDSRRTLIWGRIWRSACVSLAGDIDAVVGDYLATILGARPW